MNRAISEREMTIKGTLCADNKNDTYSYKMMRSAPTKFRPTPPVLVVHSIPKYEVSELNVSTRPCLDATFVLPSNRPNFHPCISIRRISQRFVMAM